MRSTSSGALGSVLVPFIVRSSSAVQSVFGSDHLAHPLPVACDEDERPSRRGGAGEVGLNSIASMKRFPRRPRAAGASANGGRCRPESDRRSGFRSAPPKTPEAPRGAKRSVREGSARKREEDCGEGEAITPRGVPILICFSKKESPLSVLESVPSLLTDRCRGLTEAQCSSAIGDRLSVIAGHCSPVTDDRSPITECTTSLSSSTV